MKARLTLATLVVTAAALVFVLSTPPVSAGGSVSGTVTLAGDAPQRRAIKMDADPKCQAANPDGRLGEVFVVNDGKVENVFVYVKEGLGDKKFEPPKEAAVIDQKGCMYSPHVIGVMVGQTIEIHNSDDTLHNVHSLAENTKQFNSAMPMKGMTIKKRYQAPEVMAKMKCDVHPWMAAYVGVVDHPFFAVSGADGSFTISDLPAGTYTLEAWHEKMGTQTMQVTVSDGGSATADFSFSPKG